MSTKQIRAVGYYRVSTLLGQSVDNQAVPIREYCKIRGFELNNEYSDEGVSGAKDRRPALDRLIKDARAGKFNVLIVAALDRLGRNVKHLLTMLDELDSIGVTFVSLREGFDASTPQGRMIMTILGAFAEMEREITRTRIRESLAAKKIMAKQSGSGWRCGRPTVVNDEIIKQVLELRSDGLSVRAIEARLNKIISRASVERILKAHSHKTSEQIHSKTSMISTLENENSDTSKPLGFVTATNGKAAKG